jgi:hypothetical protein
MALMHRLPGTGTRPLSHGSRARDWLFALMT